MEKYKLLYASGSGFPTTDAGGGNKVINDLIRNISYSKFEVSYFSYDFNKVYNTVQELNLDQSTYLPFQRVLGRRLANHSNIYKNITTSMVYLTYHYRKRDRFYKSHLKSYENFNIIHSFDTFIGFQVQKYTKAKKILTIQSKGSATSELIEEWPDSFLAKKILARLRNREYVSVLNSDLLVFPSRSASKLFFDDLGIENYPPEKIKVIYNGIDLEYINNITPDKSIFQKYNLLISPDSKVILNVANHVKPKNIDLLMHALFSLKNQAEQKTVLINIGTGAETTNLLQLRNELKLNDSLFFLGSIPNRDVIQIMKLCNLLVMPSERVVFDIALLESLACGMTVVVSTNGGNLEVIKDGINGHLISELTHFSIKEKILFALKNKTQKCARETAEKYSIKKMTRDYENLYLSLLNDF